MFEFTLDELMVSIEILWKGMAGIITATVLIMIIVMIMQKITKVKKPKTKDE